MSLQIYTARLSTRDPDALNITRKSAGQEGICFAPSWSILEPALAARAKASALRMAAKRGGDPGAEARAALEAGAITGAAWLVYVDAYKAEMRESYRLHRSRWMTLLLHGLYPLGIALFVPGDGSAELRLAPASAGDGAAILAGWLMLNGGL